MENQNYEMVTEEDAFKELGKREREAKEILQDESKTMKLLLALEKECEHLPKKLEIFKYLPIMGELIYKYIKKEYTNVPFATMVSIVSAVLYGLKHFDLIPDSIPVLGKLDDALVLKVALKSAKYDIDKFIEWRDKQ